MGPQGNAVRAPAPTAGPSRREVNRRLGIRQDDGDICGWGYSLPGLNGGPATNSLALTCPAGSQCVVNSIDSVQGCCPDDNTNCPIPTSCWDRTLWLASSLDMGEYTLACTDEGRQYCAELSYPNGYSTFGCDPTSGIVENAIFGSAPPTPAAGTTTPTTTPEPSTPTTPSPAPATSTAAATAAAAPVLSTGAIVGIAIAGTVIILGALIVFYLIRRLNAKKADAKVREADLLRNTIMEQQRVSQVPSASMHTASWINSQKGPEPSVTEYSPDYANRAGTMYNDDIYEGTVDGTVAGTVDHYAAPRF